MLWHSIKKIQELCKKFELQNQFVQVKMSLFYSIINLDKNLYLMINYYGGKL